jgi:hypothetical protein
LFFSAFTSLSVVPTRSSVSSRRVATNIKEGGTISLTRLGGDQQTTFIRPTSDLNNSRLQRSLIQVSSRGWRVAVGTTRNQRVSRAKQGLTVTTT